MVPTIDPSSIHLYRPSPDSRKGDNGRLLVIGGSKLFHSSIFWAADVASRIVDLVHFTSPANENNELVRKKLKDGFWNGIVVDWRDVEHYIEEDDCILIGPGMIRRQGIMNKELGIMGGDVDNPDSKFIIHNSKEHIDLIQASEKDDTATIVNTLLARHSTKRWVIDGGALQEVDPGLLHENMIITPNLKEFQILSKKVHLKYSQDSGFPKSEVIAKLSLRLGGCTIVLKGPTDIICQKSRCALNRTGNEGMTKGGTGDVMAGLIAALYSKNSAWSAATAGAYVNGLAGDRLKQRVGVYFNAGDLVSEVPQALASLAAAGAS